MAITKLTPKQIQTVINDTYAQITGKVSGASVDVSDVVDVGVKELTDYRDNFTGALLVRLTKLWYTDTAYRSNIANLYLEDEQTFGAICQYIHVTPPVAIANSAWEVADGSTVGVYTVHAPQVDTRYFVKSDTFEIPLDISSEQLRTSFSNDTELQNFVSYCWLALDNAITQHAEDMASANRNAFICQKFIAQYASGNTKIHLYDLVRAYVNFAGIQTTYTVKMAENDPDFYRFASREIARMAGFLGKQTNKFNVGDSVKFVPKDRLVIELLGSWVDYANAISFSGTFNADLVKLPLYNATPAWQFINDLDMADLGRIHLNVGTDVDTRTYGSQSNTLVVGLACDKFALAHTTVNKRVATQYLSVEDVTINRAQFHDKYLNNLELPAIVFTMSDVIV